MDDIFTEQGKRLLKSWLKAGKFLVGLSLSFGLNAGSTAVFLQSITNVRSDHNLENYGVMLLVLMVLEIAVGHSLKQLNPVLGKGVMLGGGLTLLTPVVLLYCLP